MTPHPPQAGPPSSPPRLGATIGELDHQGAGRRFRSISHFFKERLLRRAIQTGRGDIDLPPSPVQPSRSSRCGQSVGTSIKLAHQGPVGYCSQS